MDFRTQIELPVGFTAYYSCRTNTHDGILLCPKCREFLKDAKFQLDLNPLVFFTTLLLFCCSD